MTHAVARGTGSNASKSSGIPMQVDAATSPMNWKREGGDIFPARGDRKPTLEPGVGPRPGRLDHAPVVPRKPDAAPHPRNGIAGSNGSGRWGHVVGAGRRAIRQEIGSHPFLALLHPKIAVISAGVVFIANLLSGRK